MARNLKLWTMKELERLKQWRMQGAPVELIAHRLRRTRQSVYVQLHRQGVVIEPHHDSEFIRRRVRRLHAGKSCDAMIALCIGRSKQDVRRVRNQLGLKANKPQTWRRDWRPRCWNCSVISPVTKCPGWTRLTGWQTRLIPGFDIVEVRCPKCFREYGWGNGMESSSVNGKPKQGQRVKVNAPDEPAVHGYEAVVEKLTEWGAHLLINRPVRPNDAPNHTPRWRALWSEMIVLEGTRLQAAREMGFTGDPCTSCGSIRVIRTGTCLRCEDCHCTSGCG